MLRDRSPGTSSSPPLLHTYFLSCGSCSRPTGSEDHLRVHNRRAEEQFQRNRCGTPGASCLVDRRTFSTACLHSLTAYLPMSLAWLEPACHTTTSGVAWCPRKSWIVRGRSCNRRLPRPNRRTWLSGWAPRCWWSVLLALSHALRTRLSLSIQILRSREPAGHRKIHTITSIIHLSTKRVPHIVMTNFVFIWVCIVPKASLQSWLSSLSYGTLQL